MFIVTQCEHKPMVFKLLSANVSSLSFNLSRDPILLSANVSRKGALFASRAILVVEQLHLERARGKYQTVRLHDGRCKLRHYRGEVRQVILTDHGRAKPSFLITNDFEMEVRQIVHKYARRCWSNRRSPSKSCSSISTTPLPRSWSKSISI